MDELQTLTQSLEAAHQRLHQLTGSVARLQTALLVHREIAALLLADRSQGDRDELTALHRHVVGELVTTLQAAVDAEARDYAEAIVTQAADDLFSRALNLTPRRTGD